jgi:hypothetical protein
MLSIFVTYGRAWNEPSNTLAGICYAYADRSAEAHGTFERRPLDRVLPEITGDHHNGGQALINFRNAWEFTARVNGDARINQTVRQW